jgi:hypothetical protein
VPKRWVAGDEGVAMNADPTCKAVAARNGF